VTLSLGVTSDRLQRPLDAALYWSYLIAASMGIGLYWWRRRPASRFGPLLVVFGVLTWIVSWQGANFPLAFALGVVAEGPFFVLTFYLFLAFPMGRLEPPAARWLMVALVLGVLAFFIPWTLFAPVIAGGGPLTSCAPNCPENALQVGTAPTVVEVAGKRETYVALALTVAVLVVYAWRLYRSSRPQRRALTAVAVTSLLFLPAYFVVNFAAWVLYLDPATISALAWGIVATRVLLPLGFLVALLQADRFRGDGAPDRSSGWRCARPRTSGVTRSPRPWTTRSCSSAIAIWWVAASVSTTAASSPRHRPAGPGCRSIAPTSRSRRWCSTRPWPKTRSSYARRRRPPGWRSRTAPSRGRCARHARASCEPATPSAGGSSSSSTTARNSV